MIATRSHGGYRLQGAVALVMALAAITVAASQSPPQQSVFYSGISTGLVSVSVHDQGKRVVRDLTLEDFAIAHEGRAIPLTSFAAGPHPLSLIVMLDVGYSVAPRLGLIRQSASAVVDLLAPEDRAAVGTFNEEIALAMRPSGDTRAMRRIIAEELWPAGGAFVWSALLRAISSLRDEDGIRAVIMISDGQSRCPPEALSACGSAGAAKAAAIENGVTVYSLTPSETIFANTSQRPCFPESWCTGAPSGGGQRTIARDGSLDGIARDTNGAAVGIRRIDDARVSVAAAMDELRYRYLIGFDPIPGRAQLGNLRIAARRTGLTVRAWRYEGKR